MFAEMFHQTSACCGVQGQSVLFFFSLSPYEVSPDKSSSLFVNAPICIVPAEAGCSARFNW